MINFHVSITHRYATMQCTVCDELVMIDEPEYDGFEKHLEIFEERHNECTDTH